MTNPRAITTPPDPRLTPARPDLAAESLRGIVDAPRYVEGTPRRVVAAVAPLRRRPACDAPLDTEALFGETLRVYDTDAEGWSFVQLDADQYVGYVPSDVLAPPDPAGPTHKVAALRTFLFPGPDIKLPPLAALPGGSRVSVRDLRGAFAVTPDGFVPAVHLVPVDVRVPDFVAEAARFLGTPYLWGGRSSLGIDCSGLVQAALAACGVAAPRDSDMQEAALGVEVPADTPPARGDLLFWPGHVAIAEGPDTLLHANAFHMAVAREARTAALERISGAGLPLRRAKRLPSP